LTGRVLRRFVGVTLLALVLTILPAAVGADGKSEGKPVTPPPANPTLHMKVPENVADLQNLEKQVKVVVEKVTPATVGLQVGGSSGSGVIISEDGYVLTAGHVSGKPGQEVTVIFPDGKKVKAKSLGMNKAIDSGLVKITDEGKYPFCEMGKSSPLKKGQWVISIGHPGGFKQGRTPPVRVGRVQEISEMLVRTDCTLVGGDSGGPLFDLDGKVIGIHSRIGGTISTNIHVPVDTYRDTWDRLVASEVGGIRGFTAPEPPYLGLTFGDKTQVDKIDVDSPAAKAGFKEKDVVLKFDGAKVETLEELKTLLGKKKPGDEVSVEVRRGEKETLTLKIVLGKKG
jgi:serine protease Do